MHSCDVVSVVVDSDCLHLPFPVGLVVLQNRFSSGNRSSHFELPVAKVSFFIFTRVKDILAYITASHTTSTSKFRPSH